MRHLPLYNNCDIYFSNNILYINKLNSWTKLVKDCYCGEQWCLDIRKREIQGTNPKLKDISKVQLNIFILAVVVISIFIMWSILIYTTIQLKPSNNSE